MSDASIKEILKRLDKLSGQMRGLSDRDDELITMVRENTEAFMRKFDSLEARVARLEGKK